MQGGMDMMGGMGPGGMGMGGRMEMMQSMMQTMMDRMAPAPAGK